MLYLFFLGLAPKTKFDGHIDIGLPSTKELSNRSTRLEDRKALRNNQEIKKLTLRKECNFFRFVYLITNYFKNAYNSYLYMLHVYYTMVY